MPPRPQAGWSAPNASCPAVRAFDQANLGGSQWTSVGFVLGRQFDGHVVQRNVDGLGLIDAQAFRQALCGFARHAGGAVNGALVKAPRTGSMCLSRCCHGPARCTIAGRIHGY